MNGKDIYRTTHFTRSEWSRPENLGADINTRGNELFPISVMTEPLFCL
ncbi:MAG: hypothetical protein R2756_13540 [Bacteroidales bacterium]